METKYLNEYSMRQASIYDLRNIAREIGVNSPTTLKKEELIDKVLKILNGEAKPEMPKSKQGRPPKKIFTNSDLLQQKSSNEDLFFDEPITNVNMQDEIGVLSSSKNFEDEVEYDNYEYSMETKTGYYYKMNDGTSFVFECGHVSNVDLAILVPKNIVQEYNLQNGDLVKCKCKKIMAKDIRFLTEVLEINFNKKANAKSFSNMEVVTSNNQLPDCSIFPNAQVGSRNIAVINTKQQFMSVLNYYSNIDEENTKVVTLSLEVLPEDENNYKCAKSNCENFYTLVGDSTKQNVFTIELVIDRIKRLAELNFNVIVCVEDLIKLVKFKNFLEGYSIKDIKNKSLDLCLNLLTTARCFKNNAITVFAGLISRTKDDFVNTIIEELYSVNCNIVNN